MKLNLCCGRKIKEGYVNVDIVERENVTSFDLNSTQPIDSGVVEKIVIENGLEHLDDVFFFMKEAYRVLMPFGRLFVKVPYYNAEGAFRVDHKHFFHAEWYKFFTDNDSDTLYGDKNLFLLE